MHPVNRDSCKRVILIWTIAIVLTIPATAKAGGWGGGGGGGGNWANWVKFGVGVAEQVRQTRQHHPPRQRSRPRNEYVTRDEVPYRPRNEYVTRDEVPYEGEPGSSEQAVPLIVRASVPSLLSGGPPSNFDQKAEIEKANQETARRKAEREAARQRQEEARRRADQVVERLEEGRQAVQLLEDAKAKANEVWNNPVVQFIVDEMTAEARIEQRRQERLRQQEAERNATHAELMKKRADLERAKQDLLNHPYYGHRQELARSTRTLNQIINMTPDQRQAVYGSDENWRQAINRLPSANSVRRPSAEEKVDFEMQKLKFDIEVQQFNENVRNFRR